MAKPRLPKKTNGVASPNPITPQAESMTESSVAPVQAAPVVSETVPTATETPKTESRRFPRKTKTENRATVVPINLEDEIRNLAYLLSERRGFEPGHETEDWLAAEHEVRQRYDQHTA